MPKNQFAGDIQDLRADADKLKTQHAEAFAAAEKLAAETKASKPDVAREGGPEFDAIVEAYKAADTLKAEQASIVDRLQQLVVLAGSEAPAATTNSTSTKAATIGGRFAASDVYLEALAAGVFDGGGEVHLPRLDVASRDELVGMFKAATFSGLDFIAPDNQRNPAAALPRRKVSLLDLVSVLQTGSNAVEYLAQTTRSAATTVVAPGTASAESVPAYVKQVVNVKRRAAHTPVLKSQLADEPRMRSELDDELAYAVRLQTENQILSGDGTGENWRGVTATAGIGTFAGSLATASDAIHSAMTLVRINLEDDITAIGLHPNDFHNLTIKKGSSGHYVSNTGPNEPEPMTIWGYPAIVSTAFTSGTAVVGNWANACLWVRSGLTIESGFIDKQFISDMATLAAEYRGAFAVKRPQAFATVTGLAV